MHIIDIRPCFYTMEFFQLTFNTNMKQMFARCILFPDKYRAEFHYDTMESQFIVSFE